MFRADPERTGMYEDGDAGRFSGLKWRFKAKKNITSTPLVFEGKVFFGSYDRMFYAVDCETGKEGVEIRYRS